MQAMGELAMGWTAALVRILSVVRTLGCMGFGFVRNAGLLPVGGRALQKSQFRKRGSRRGERQQQGENHPPDCLRKLRRTDHLQKITLLWGL